MHNQTSLEAIAASLITSFGHTFINVWQAGTDESTSFIFKTAEDQVYSVEFGDVYEEKGVDVYAGNIEEAWEAPYDEDTDDEEDALGRLRDKKVWSLQYEGMENDTVDWNSPPLVWAIGALTIFLTDLKEGQINAA